MVAHLGRPYQALADLPPPISNPEMGGARRALSLFVIGRLEDVRETADIHYRGSTS